jgi:hypothetical protein
MRSIVLTVVASAVLALCASPAAAISVTWGGDTTLGSSYGMPPDRGWPQLSPVADVLRRADLAAVNYEGTFAPGGASKCAGATGGNCFAFQAPAANATTLRRAGVDVVNLANNHAFDYGPLGYGGTRRALTAARVGFTGAPGEIRVVTVVGQKVAMLGFASYRWSSPINDPLRVAALVREASAMADLVIVFFHGGAEGADKGRVPYGHEQAFGEDRGNLREFSHVAVDAGADLVLGSGPHVLRGMERYRDRLIAYSLGNLAGWKNFGTGGATSLSALLTVQLSPRGTPIGGAVTSLRLDGTGVPHRDSSRAAESAMRRLSTADFGRRAIWFSRGKPRS